MFGFFRRLRSPGGARPPPRLPWPEGSLGAQRHVIFDLEATGLRPSRGDAIVAIGAVRVRNGTEEDRFFTLVLPGRAIPAASTVYHGITDAMVADAPPVPHAIAAFAAFAGTDVLVAHNAAYDGALLRVSAERGAPHLPNPLLCSLALSRWLDPQEPDHSLDGLCGRHGIVIAGRHDALGDALATAELWSRLLARAAERGVADLADLARRTRLEAALRQGAEIF